MFGGFFSTNLGQIFMVDIGIQWIAFLFANYFKTEKFYDLTGSITFITSMYLSYNLSPVKTTRQLVQSTMVMLWAFRLGTFLFVRVIKDGQDRRFDKIKASALRFFNAWTIQGLWVFITSLPTLMLNDSNVQDQSIGLLEKTGWAMWALGMTIELAADYQKTVFRSNEANKGTFIRSGLWSISRHPNYFGEILLWAGLYVSASSVFSGYQYLAVLSPVFVYLLITKLSGVPMLEKAGEKKWGHLKEYKQYLSNTPCLVPFTKP